MQKWVLAVELNWRWRSGPADSASFPMIAMKINRITVWKVPLTSHETYYMADGKKCDTVDSVVIALDTDQGLTGWGEV